MSGVPLCRRSQLHASRRVHVENADSRTPDRRDPNNNRAIGCEMVRPDLQSWIEEGNHRSTDRINAAEVWTFVKVAMMASPSEVGLGSRAAVLTCDNVFAVKPKERILRLVGAAIFATIAGSVADEISNSDVQSNSLGGRSVGQNISRLGLENRDDIRRGDQRFIFGPLLRSQRAVVGAVGQIVDLRLCVGIGAQCDKLACGLGRKRSADGIEQAIKKRR